jgi:hypothetical protein
MSDMSDQQMGPSTVTTVAFSLWVAQNEDLPKEHEARKEAFKEVAPEYRRTARRLVRVLEARGITLVENGAE